MHVQLVETTRVEPLLTLMMNDPENTAIAIKNAAFPLTVQPCNAEEEKRPFVQSVECSQ
jgi:hypothetical protein